MHHYQELVRQPKRLNQYNKYMARNVFFGPVNKYLLYEYATTVYAYCFPNWTHCNVVQVSCLPVTSLKVILRMLEKKVSPV